MIRESQEASCSLQTNIADEMKFIHTSCSTKQLQLLRAQLGMP